MDSEAYVQSGVEVGHSCRTLKRRFDQLNPRRGTKEQKYHHITQLELRRHFGTPSLKIVENIHSHRD